MSAETILTNVLYEIGLKKSSPQLSGSDFDVLQIRQFMNAAGKDVARRADWNNLFVTKTVAGSVSAENLPSDFFSLAETGPVWLTKSSWQPVRVVVEPELWDFLSVQSSTQPYCHIQGGQIKFAPTLDSDGAKYRYVSSQWVAGKDEITENADTLNVPERLVEKGTIWRWKRQKGLAYEDVNAEYEADILAEIKADRGEA